MGLRDRSELAHAKRVVVKVGSSSISGVNEGKIEQLVDALAAAHSRGVEVILVSSGAIATGLPLLNLTEKPDDLATQQALASVGQSRLISRYQASLERFNIIAGQVLLTSGDMEEEETRLNAKRAMDKLVSLRVLPIVNENDTVATAEIRFGDNDRLAALVAVLVEAEALVLLSDVDALYDMPPTKPGAKRIERVAYGADLSNVE
ncbi:MAG: glutamate 5-kinase, partial [Rhodoluna sp.]|nr:glutamate 5-kinase [Rhodoluna sp.]